MAPPTVTKHLLLTIPVKELIAKLDALAVDDWEVVEVFPMVTNIVALGEGGKVICLLRREVKP